MNRNPPNHLSIVSDEGPELSSYIQPTDEAIAVPKPSNIDKFYIQQEYEEAETEQIKLHAQQGKIEARPADLTASRLTYEADKAISISELIHDAFDAARARRDRAYDILAQYRRRATDAKILKWARWGLILGGDIAGVAGAALLLGETPTNAFLLATSAAVSAVTLGAVGADVKYAMARRDRQKDLRELTDGEKEFASFFTGPNTAETILKGVVLVAITGFILIATGIFSLRNATEGLTAGLVFGCIALALGLASAINSYSTACEVAEALDGFDADAKKHEKKAYKASQNQAIGARAAAVTEDESIRAAHENAGLANAAAIRRQLYKVLGSSPGVAGNGCAATDDDEKAA